jgi:hypothetical protein
MRKLIVALALTAAASTAVAGGGHGHRHGHGNVWGPLIVGSVLGYAIGSAHGHVNAHVHVPHGSVHMHVPPPVYSYPSHGYHRPMEPVYKYESFFNPACNCYVSHRVLIGYQ